MQTRGQHNLITLIANLRNEAPKIVDEQGLTDLVNGLLQQMAPGQILTVKLTKK